jgi:hypothetical protein
VNTGAIRGVLLVAGIVVGAVVIANGFPTASTGPGPSAHHSPSPPSQQPSPPATPAKQKLQCPSSSGVHAAVENATSTAGLAAATVRKLQPAGYTISAATDIGNATNDSATTTVYFRGSANRDPARCLKKKFFPMASIRPLTPDATAFPRITSAVQVAVFLGADYAATHPVH